MKLSKKSKFQLEVLAEHGVLPLYEGRDAPDFVACPEEGERVGPFCRRVVGRPANEVTFLGECEVDPKLSMKRLASKSPAALMGALLKEHSSVARRAAAMPLEEKLAASQSENSRLRSRLKALEKRNAVLEEQSKTRRSKQALRDAEDEREIVAASLRFFLEEEAGRLEGLVVQKGLDAAARMKESGPISAGYWMLFHFVNERVKMAR